MRGKLNSIFLVKYGLCLLIIISCSTFRPPELEMTIIDYHGGRYNSAFIKAQEVVEKYPDNAEGWYYLGQLYALKGNAHEMEKCFTRSLSLDPSTQIKNRIEFAKADLASFREEFKESVSK